MLFNDEFIVFDASSEEEAIQHARNILWAPIFQDGLFR